MLWTSHLSAAETLDKNPDDDARIVAIRAIAKKYDCLLIDVAKENGSRTSRNTTWNPRPC